MSRIVLAILVCSFSLAAAAAEKPPKFTGEAHDHTVAAYSSSDKPSRCEVVIPFTFAYEGHREHTATTCYEKDIPAGKHVEVCSFTHPTIVDPKLEGPVRAKCK